MKMAVYYQRCFSSLLHISVLYLFWYSGGNCLVVETSVGDYAVLPCGVDPNIDATEMAVEWSRPDLPHHQYVHFQRNGREFDENKNPSYKGRTYLFMDEVKKGNVSLKLSRVQSTDQGIYTCFLPEIPNRFTVQLTVASMLKVPEVSFGDSVDNPGMKIPTDDDTGAYSGYHDSYNGSTEDHISGPFILGLVALIICFQT